MQKKSDIYIFEPNLENRKPLAQLLPLSRFVIKFSNDLDELLRDIELRIPHIIIINFSTKGIKFKEVMGELVKVLPKQTMIVGACEKAMEKKLNPYLGKGLVDLWEFPIAGLKIKPKINEIVDRIAPIKVSFDSPKDLFSRIEGEILAMGEAEFLAKFPMQLKIGSPLSIYSEFLNDLLGEDEKKLIVVENRHGIITNNQITVSILGLKNNVLKNIRAKILNWDKL